MVSQRSCRAVTNLLQSQNDCATMTKDYVLVSRQDLETEHRQLLSRLHHIRRLLGLPQLETERKQRNERNSSNHR